MQITTMEFVCTVVVGIDTSSVRNTCKFVDGLKGTAFKIVTVSFFIASGINLRRAALAPAATASIQTACQSACVDLAN